MYKVLIVDDDPSILELNRDIFEESNYQVSTAENGKIALEKTTDTAFDLIVTDLIMPEMGGLDFICALKDSGIDTPIIVVTGDESETLGIVEGMADAVFPKPYTHQELSYAADLILKNKAS